MGYLEISDPILRQEAIEMAPRSREKLARKFKLIIYFKKER